MFSKGGLQWRERPSNCGCSRNFPREISIITILINSRYFSRSWATWPTTFPAVKIPFPKVYLLGCNFPNDLENACAGIEKALSDTCPT